MIRFDKKTYMPIIILVSICIVVAALLAGVNMITEQRIKNASAEKENESLSIVMPEGSFNDTPDTLREDAPDTVKSVYTDKNGKGHVVLLTTNKGYTGKNISLTVAIDTEGKIINAVITQNEESIVPSDLRPMGSYGEKYKGLNAEEANALVTGATVKFTESAIKGALSDAFRYLGYLEQEQEPDLPDAAKEESEILALASDLVENSAGFTKVELDGSYENLIYVFKENGGKGYVAYTLVMSRYGYPETETLIHIGTDAKIKSVKKIVWKTSDAMYGYVPPSAELVDRFYGRLPNNNSASIDSVTLVSNATNTSTNLVNSIKEALSVTEELIRKDMPSPESEVLSLAADLVGGSSEFEDVTPDGAEYLKRLYRNSADGSYVAYLVVFSRYGTVETETLVHIGENGKIKGIKRMVWKTSDAMYGYVPPTLEEAEVIYTDLVGSNSRSVDGVTLVSNATNTSMNLIDSVKEALLAVEELEKSCAPRVIGIAAVVLLVGSWAAVFVIMRKRRAPYEK